MHRTHTGEGIYKSVEPDEPNARRIPDHDPVTPLVAKAVQMAATVLKIVSEYDVRQITPRKIAELSERLYRAGAIGLPEHAILSFQPERHGDYDAQAGRYPTMAWAPDQPRDFVIEWQAHLAALLREKAHPATIDLTRELGDLIRSFQPVGET